MCFLLRDVSSPISLLKLHPLIHTIAPETSAQDVGNKKAEPKTPHFSSLKQDIVALSQEAKWGLK